MAIPISEELITLIYYGLSRRETSTDFEFVIIAVIATESLGTTVLRC